MKKKVLYHLFTICNIIIAIVLDQLTKYLAVVHLKDKPSFVIWKDVFCLQYLENRGAAFGMLQNQRVFFIVSTILVLAALVFIYIRMPHNKRFLPLSICITYIASGAIGNFIDRFRLGYVIDFFYFELIDFPIFNMADIYVTVSAILLCIILLFYYKDDEFDSIFKKKAKRKDNE